jgi:uncharacterized protein YnzC (UPF0291/DUF896 family)
MDKQSIGERLNELQRRVDSGRFTGAERQELETLLTKYIELDKLTQEREELERERDRMYRSPKLSVTEIEIMLQLVSEGLTESFRAGNHQKTDRLQGIKDKLKNSIIKE